MEASSSVHLKLSLATATIVFGHVCRRLDVVSRENGESMLALIFGILLPSLLIQVEYIFFCTRVFFSLWCTIIIIIIIIIANSVHVCDAFVRFCVSSRRKKEGRKNTPPRVERSSLVFGPQKKRGVKCCV